MDPRIRITLTIIAEQKAPLQCGATELSKMLGLSEAHLLRLFHREVGKTLRKYLRETRMIRAAELMKQSSPSLKQIAIECGYNDVSNFYRDFNLSMQSHPSNFFYESLILGAIVPQQGNSCSPKLNNR